MAKEGAGTAFSAHFELKPERGEMKNSLRSEKS
jgi:hypothetical protein